MSYQVLARQWRPKTFEDFVGQEHVLRVLMNALNQKRLHHAYLFAGTRGVGKTTIARIFAKCINCEQSLSPQPCGICTSCRAIDAGQYLDLYEIDAASRTKVEDMRELLENVTYPPVQGRYKVYLIDEVHMLSTHSFNALLKTLEEPPPQVIFIFATTEPKRLPITILSRCLQFHLKQIAPEQIVTQLKRICDSEKCNAESKALALLARAADGSLRDALSLLDQAIVYCQDELTFEQVNQMLGYISQDEILGLFEALTAQDSKHLFEVLAQLEKRAPDYQQVLAELLSCLHQMAVVQQLPEYMMSEALIKLAQQFSAEDIQLYYQIALLGRKDLAFMPSPAQGFEMVMLRMLAFKPISTETSTGVRNKILPLQQIQNKSQEMHPQVVSQENVASNNKVAKNISSEWQDILSQLGLTGMAYALALHCNLKKITDQTVELMLAASYKPMLNAKLVERIEQALNRYFNKTLSLSIQVTADDILTPAKQQTQEQEMRRNTALEALQQSPGVQKIQTLFNAKIDAQSLEIASDD